MRGGGGGGGTGRGIGGSCEISKSGFDPAGVMWK